MNHFDSKSILGCITSYYFAYIGIFSLNKLATIVAILVGISTLVYNYIKIKKELKK